MKNDIYYNEEFISSNIELLPHKNRAFKYGDALFETILCFNKQPLYLQSHIERLKKSMCLLQMEWNTKLEVDALNNTINDLLTKNDVNITRVRLTVFRIDGGHYLPTTNTVSYVIENSPFELQKNIKKGMHLGVFNEIKKPISKYSNIKSTSALMYVMASIYKQQNNFDECLILNQNNDISECITSNIFVVKNNIIYTPPLEDACVAGVMRSQFFNWAVKNKIEIIQKSMNLNFLLNADEVFLTNTLIGFKWVQSFDKKEYSNTYFLKLSTDLKKEFIYF